MASTGEVRGEVWRVATTQAEDALELKRTDPAACPVGLLSRVLVFSGACRRHPERIVNRSIWIAHLVCSGCRDRNITNELRPSVNRKRAKTNRWRRTAIGKMRRPDSAHQPGKSYRRCRLGWQKSPGGETRGLKGAAQCVVREHFQFAELQGAAAECASST